MRVECEQIPWDEQLELFRVVRETGDARVRERLILSCVPLATSLARKFSRCRPSLGMAEPGEIEAQAMLLLVVAVDNFDPGSGYRFSTTLRTQVTQGLDEYMITRLGPVPVPHEARYNLSVFYRVRNRRARDKADSSDDAVFAELRWKEARREGTRSLLRFLCRRWSGTSAPNGMMLLDNIPDDRAGKSDGYAARLRVARMLRVLTPRARTIVRMRYGLRGPGATIDATAAAVGVKRMCCWKAEKSALKKMRAAC